MISNLTWKMRRLSPSQRTHVENEESALRKFAKMFLFSKEYIHLEAFHMTKFYSFSLTTQFLLQN